MTSTIRDWLKTAPPEARLGYLVGQRHAGGYHIDHDTIAQLAFSAGLRAQPPTVNIIRITVPKPAFDPTKPCAYPGCTDPIGDRRVPGRGGGRPPVHCPKHRRANHRKPKYLTLEEWARARTVTLDEWARNHAISKRRAFLYAQRGQLDVIKLNGRIRLDPDATVRTNA